MAFSLDQALGLHAQALSLRAQRAGVIASNIANADTPHYHARDIDFRAALASAAGQAPLATSHARHLQPYGASAPGQAMYRVPTQPAVDGNTVDAHLEKSAFADNAVRYQASLRFLNGRIRGLLDALQGA